ncbi:MAG: hypothetical protein II893_00645 [Methanomicrobium sp.]|nr:hypothetical protein [Methanomicrobium sp.]
MGSGRGYVCPKCGFEFVAETGIGFMFPMVYAMTVEKAKKGELGEEIQNFFKEHKDGAIDAESVVLCCENCGHLTTDMDLTMYIPKEKKPEKSEYGRWSVAAPFEGADCVSLSDIEENYTKFAEYPHKCEKCGGRMKILRKDEDDDNDLDLVCPECGTPLEESGMLMMWD